MNDPECPHCNAAIDYYFEDTEDEWTILTPHTHELTHECERGCTEISELETVIDCRNCGEDIYLSCTYYQPCNANGYVVALELKPSGVAQ